MAFQCGEVSDAMMEALRMRCRGKTFGSTDTGGGGNAHDDQGAGKESVAKGLTPADNDVVRVRAPAGSQPRVSADVAASAALAAVKNNESLSGLAPSFSCGPAFRPVEGGAPTRSHPPRPSSGCSTVSAVTGLPPGPRAFSTSAAPAAATVDFKASHRESSRPASSGRSRPQLQPRAHAQPPPMPGSCSNIGGIGFGGASGSTSASPRPPLASSRGMLQMPNSACQQPSPSHSVFEGAEADPGEPSNMDAVVAEADWEATQQAAETEEALSAAEAAASAATAAAMAAVGMQQPGTNAQRMVMPKIPSAACLGGVPVAIDGDLVYLGGGLYAAASAPPPQEPSGLRKQHKPRILPGRVRAPPRSHGQRQGRGSAIRSASAHILGQKSSCNGGDLSPTPSRATSDKSTAKPSGPQAWRPAGRSKKPPTPELAPAAERHRSADEVLASGAGPGAFSEARAAKRSENFRDMQSAGLFGAQGMLAQLRDGEAREARERVQQNALSANGAMPPRPVVGAPKNGIRREAERRAQKEAKIQVMLEERNARLAAVAAEAEEKRAIVRRAAMNSASAPDIRKFHQVSDMLGGSGDGENDDESTKQRIACKMQMLDMFNGYKAAARNLTATQAKSLLAKLQQQGTNNSGQGDEGMDDQGEDYEDEAGYQHGENQDYEDQEEYGPQSIHERMRQVNDDCNRAFKV
eukprot:TRINITY_DN44441_c0_g1_i1.p1 TRINITY_DN44441_c0_g1~~TRINITY_DN44441_c0_g1_i1.p1  ORF type:complete len:693 (+),score=129.10 TRINITY_DN44441_c0_g1_i1:77-2155(+)